MPGATFYGFLKHNRAQNMAEIIIEKDSLPGFQQFQRRLRAAEDKTGELRLLKLIIDYHFKKRTVEQNALMWVLYTIEAYAQNAGQSGADAQMVKPMDLYESDILNYAPIVEIKVKTEYLQYIQQEYRKTKVMDEKNGETRLAIWVTTSHYDTKQMAYWIDRILNRMAYFGIPYEKQAEVHRIWKDWRQLLNDERINLHDDVVTADEYKQAVQICEATGIYLGHGGGSLAHIAARGMGGNQEDWKDEPGNWLHLCDAAHALFDNGKGRAAFLKEYPHLKNKVEAALKKEVSNPEIF